MLLAELRREQNYFNGHGAVDTFDQNFFNIRGTAGPRR